MQTVCDQRIFEFGAGNPEPSRNEAPILTMPAHEVRLGQIFFFGGMVVSALMLLGIYSLGFSL